MLISPEYREQQEKLHENPNYGVASMQYADTVINLINTLGVTEVLDYGAGKGRLGMTITENEEKLMGPLQLYQYDPGVEEIAEAPDPAQMVVCIDVLEHIEPELLDNVLDDLKRVTDKVGFFTIHTGPAVKVLPDGRNAHLIQEDYTWWLPKLWERFRIHSFSHDQHGFKVICRSLTTQN